MIAGAGVGIALFAGWMYYKSQLPNMPPASLPTQISTEDITQTVVNETYDSDYVPSPDFRYGARVSNDNILHVDPFIEDTPTKSFPIEMSASNLYWSPDSTRIATVDAEICRIWDVQSGQSIAICDTDGVINSVAWSHDGQRIAISTSQGLYVCNTQSGFTIVSDENDFDSYGLTWSPDDAYLAFAEDGLIIWNVASQKQVRQFSIPPQPSDIISQIWSPSGKWLAFATRNQAWRVQPDISGSVNLLATPANTEICAIAWSPDGTQLALVLSQSDTCSTIEIWDVAQKSRVKTLNVPDAGTPLALGWQADGKTLYVLIDFNTIDTVKIEGS